MNGGISISKETQEVRIFMSLHMATLLFARLWTVILGFCGLIRFWETCCSARFSTLDGDVWSRWKPALPLHGGGAFYAIVYESAQTEERQQWGSGHINFVSKAFIKGQDSKNAILALALCDMPLGKGVRVGMLNCFSWGPALCNPMDCSLPSSSVQGILGAKTLE